MKTFMLLICALAAALLLAACGDDDESAATTTTTEAEAPGDDGGEVDPAEADPVKLVYMGDVAEALAARGDAPSFAEAIDQSNGASDFANLLAGTKEGFEQMALALRAVEPPPELAEEHDELAAASENAALVMGDVINAALDDPDSLSDQQQKADKALARFSDAIESFDTAREAEGYPPLPTFSPGQE